MAKYESELAQLFRVNELSEEEKQVVHNFFAHIRQLTAAKIAKEH